MTDAPLWLTPGHNTIIKPAAYTPAISKQAKDSDTPAYWSVQDGPIVSAYAGAPRAYALGAVGNETRIELHQGDRNFADFNEGHVCDRAMLMSRLDPIVSVGQVCQLDFDHMIEPGPRNTAAWLVFLQFHQDLGTNLPGSPPLGLYMDGGERLMIRARYGANGNDGAKGNTGMILWQDSVDVVRGKRERWQFRVLFHPKSGLLQVYRGGVRIVNYAGPLGYDTMAGASLGHGIYRATSPEVMAVQQQVANWWASPVTF